MPVKRAPDALPPHPMAHPIRVATLPRKTPTRFDLQADDEQRAQIADFLGLIDVRALRFRGELQPEGEDGWCVTGRMTAEVTQQCVATLAQVPARIDEHVRRHFVPEHATGTIDLDPEEEDEPDEFADTIDPGAVAIEVLALALDPYPRADGAEPVSLQATPPGADPLDDIAMKPFAGLAALRDKLAGNGQN